VIDDFDGTGSLEASPGFPSLSREVVAPDPATGDNPNTLLNTPIDNFNEDGEGGDGPCKEQPNDGPNWVMNVPGGAPDWQRDIVAFDIDPDEHQTEICYDCDAGHFVSGAGGATGISTFIYKPKSGSCGW
jgi:hypothetical protein